jgi:hypothetical protein
LRLQTTLLRPSGRLPWARPQGPKIPEDREAWKTADELQALIAERSGERAQRIAIFGEPDNWMRPCW